jgi:hypothetical protein
VALSRDSILGRGRAVTLAVETIPCPELGGDVVVAELTAADADAIDVHVSALRAAEKAAATKERRPASDTVPLYAERFVAWCVAADATGAKMLLVRKPGGAADGPATEPMVEEFARATPRGVMDRLWKAARRVNGMATPDEVADAAKNSEGSRGDGSGSSSAPDSGSSAGPT